MRIGVISDTHGRVFPDVYECFRGVNLILHAGDIGGEAVIDELETIARVVAVRGNVDVDLPLSRYPVTRRLELEGVSLFLCHEPSRAAMLTPPANVIIHGHTHQPKNVLIDGVLWLNPGTASKKQFGQQTRTVAILLLESGQASVEIFPLD